MPRASRARRRSRFHPYPGVQGGGAAEHRVRLALHAAHARARGPERDGNQGRRRRDSERSRSRGSGRHLHRGRRPVLQPAGAAEVPQVRHRRDDPDFAARDALALGTRSGFTVVSGSRTAACRPRRPRERSSAVGDRPISSKSARTPPACRSTGSCGARRPGSTRAPRTCSSPPHREGPDTRTRSSGLQRRTT